MVTYTVHDRLSALPLSNVKFEGVVAEQAEAFFRERVTGEFAKTEIYGECEKQFFVRDDDVHPVGTWRGEFWGKWVLSACRVARYENNDELKEFIRQAALRAISSADADGYIGSYKNPENVLPCDPKYGIEVYNTLCDHNWNVWCRKYTLWALIEAYELTHDTDILDAAVKFTDQLIDMLARLGLKIADCGTFNGLPAGSIMKPVLLLYRITENKKYLDFALSIAAEWERPDGKIPNIISNSLAMKPVHEWYPSPEKWAKAYEMMSCFDGLLELYRITGTEKYLTAAKCFYELLDNHELNLLFSVGFNDQLAHGGAYPNSISEPCDVIHWMRLCYELYKITGDVKYMDTKEEAFYNAFLASSFKDGTWGVRGVRSVGRHMVSGGQAKMKYSHCCVNNMPRGFLSMAEAFVMRDNNGLTVNFYTDFTASCDVADLKISGSYLKDGRVILSVNARRDFKLTLRIPHWSAITVINGETVTSSNGYYTTDVKCGRTDINIKFELCPILRELKEAPERFPNEDFRVRRYCQESPVTPEIMTWDKRATLVYGPLLLTRSKLVGCTEDEMFHSETVAGHGYNVRVTPIEKDGVSYAYSVEFENGTERVSGVMCDYASGTNIPSLDDMLLFNVFI